MMPRNNLTSRLMGDMEEDLIAFVSKYVDSFVKWDLMRFFHENPHTIDNVENIARYTGRDAETIGQQLSELAERELLKKTQMEKMVVYSLNPDPAVEKQLARFITASEDPQFRVKIIFHLIKGIRET